jgi:hypothetical protein
MSETDNEIQSQYVQHTLVFRGGYGSVAGEASHSAAKAGCAPDRRRYVDDRVTMARLRYERRQIGGRFRVFVEMR